MDEFERDLQAKPVEDVVSEPVVQTQQPNPEWHRFFAVHPFLKHWGRVIGVSVVSSLVVVVLAGAGVWLARENIARILLASLPATPSVLPTSNTTETTPLSPTLITPKDLSVTDVVAKTNPSVVSIEVSQTKTVTVSNSFGNLFPGFSVEQQSTPQTKIVGRGTGFFVTSDGLIVTNRHVVDFSAATFSVSTTNGKKYTATLIAKDPVFDLAVLKVLGSGFPAVELGNSDSLQLGQSVIAIGFALGEFKNSISVGVISGLSRSITAGGLSGGGTEQLEKVIQTDAAINPGNSGGPLLNLLGQVIGVNVATAQAGQSISFAIPVNNVRQVVDSVKRTGTIVRPYVGIQYVQLNADLKAKNDLTVDYGVYVQQVVSGSPANLVGIVPGDIILSIDGVKLDGDTTFAALIRGKSVGQTVTMQVLKADGVNVTLKVKLIQAPSS